MVKCNRKLDGAVRSFCDEMSRSIALARGIVDCDEEMAAFILGQALSASGRAQGVLVKVTAAAAAAE